MAPAPAGPKVTKDCNTMVKVPLTLSLSKGRTMTIDQQTQLERFRAAVQLLGGPRSAAAALAINERHVGRLLSGGSPLHTGILADLGAALLTHAGRCRALERQISPAFAANLTAGQPAQPKPRGRWSDKVRAPEHIYIENPDALKLRSDGSIDLRPGTLHHAPARRID